MKRKHFLAFTTMIALAGTSTACAERAVSVALVDPNTATEQQLAALPGLDAAKASAVVAGRPYATPTALDAVLAAQGLTSEQRTAVYGKSFVRIDLNTAADADMMLIPGLGPKMLHEFKEYRPYKAIAQFRREMGKYVDDEEVARLESYVRVN